MQVGRTRFCLLALVPLLFTVGCTHNHYYGAMPACDAPASVGRVVGTPLAAGACCDVPATAGTPVYVQTNPGRASTIITNRRPPALVTSQPVGSGFGGWRNRLDSGGATTRISGTIDDDEVTR